MLACSQQLAYRLACEAASTFAAYAPVVSFSRFCPQFHIVFKSPPPPPPTGQRGLLRIPQSARYMLNTPCTPDAPFNFMDTHASGDPVVPMSGPLCCNGTVDPTMPGLSTWASVAMIASTKQLSCSCQAQRCTRPVVVGGGGEEGKGPVQCHSFGECHDAKRVILCIVDWGKHWPAWQMHWWACGYSPGQDCSGPVSYTLRVLAFWDMVIPARSRGGGRG